MKLHLVFAATAAILIAFPAASDPLMGSSGWHAPANANRASIASLMMQREQMRHPTPSYAGAIFTCGGGSGSGGRGGATGGSATSSSSTANNGCSIVVGSKGTVITSDQVSNGDQSSKADSQSAANNPSLSTILESME